MKISNFRNLRIEYGTGFFPPSREFAEVDVTTGFWLWRKTRTEGVFRPKYSAYWRWLESGEFTPHDAVESLCDAYLAKQTLTK